MTFTITTCVAIIAWKWQAVFTNNSEGSDINTIPVGILWLTGVATFWVFTYHTYKQIGRQLEKRPLLPASFGDKKEQSIIPFDVVSIIIPLLTVAFVWILHQHNFHLDEDWKKRVCGFVTMSFFVPIVIWLDVLFFKKLGFLKNVLKATVAILILIGLAKIGILFEAKIAEFTKHILTKLLEWTC